MPSYLLRLGYVALPAIVNVRRVLGASDWYGRGFTVVALTSALTVRLARYGVRGRCQGGCLVSDGQFAASQEQGQEDRRKGEQGSAGGQLRGSANI